MQISVSRLVMHQSYILQLPSDSSHALVTGLTTLLLDDARQFLELPLGSKEGTKLKHQGQLEPQMIMDCSPQDVMEEMLTLSRYEIWRQ